MRDTYNKMALSRKITLRKIRLIKLWSNQTSTPPFILCSYCSIFIYLFICLFVLIRLDIVLTKHPILQYAISNFTKRDRESARENYVCFILYPRVYMGELKEEIGIIINNI